MQKPIGNAPSLCAIVLLFLTLAGGSTCAQSAIQSPNCTGVIQGTVSDAEGQPVHDLSVTTWPLGVDLGVVLPTATTNQIGKYSFVKICPGRYTVIPSHKNADYPFSSPDVYAFLYGERLAEARLTVEKPVVNLDIVLPPKPGRLRLQVRNRTTNSRIKELTVKITIPSQRLAPWMEIEFEPTLTEDMPEIAVPPNKDFYLQVTARGFKKWKGIDGHRNPLRIQSGTEETLHVELTPAN